MKLYLMFALFFSTNVFADTNLVTCPEWRSKQKLYVDHAKRKEVIAPVAPKGYVALYRAIAAILGSKRMSEDVNSELEKSGYSDLFDVLMSMHYRGGLPDEFIDSLKRFQKSGQIHLDSEPYVVDVSTQEMLSKLRRSYCK